jgi:hypothetical protein
MPTPICSVQMESTSTSQSTLLLGTAPERTARASHACSQATDKINCVHQSLDSNTDDERRGNALLWYLQCSTNCWVCKSILDGCACFNAQRFENSWVQRYTARGANAHCYREEEQDAHAHRLRHLGLYRYLRNIWYCDPTLLAKRTGFEEVTLRRAAVVRQRVSQETRDATCSSEATSRSKMALTASERTFAGEQC